MSLPDIMARLYGSYTHEIQDDLGAVLDELRTVQSLLQRAFESVQHDPIFREAMDRLRKVVGE